MRGKLRRDGSLMTTLRARMKMEQRMNWEKKRFGFLKLELKLQGVLLMGS